MAASYPQRGGVSSKIVKLGDTYGDLPAPTRTGYSFVGWSGKNLIGQCSKSQVSSTLAATYNSNTNEIIFANASSYATPNGYGNIEIWIYSNDTYLECLDEKSDVGGLLKGSFTKSGTTNNKLRIKANGNAADSELFFDMSSFPDGEYSISFVIKERTENSQTDTNVYPYENYVVGDIQLERSSSPTTYEPPRTVTSDSQKTSPQDETLYAIWSY